MSEVDGGSDERVRRRAYELWEEAGQPEGRDNEFWQIAEAEITTKDNGVDSASESHPATNEKSLEEKARASAWIPSDKNATAGNC